jgi:polar amino acid transport system substrate-binding protein
MNQTADLDLVRSELAPEGRMRAALNLSNFLLNSGRSPQGEWLGVAPDLARAIGQSLDVDVTFVPYPTPGELADAVDSGAWTLALIGADPIRAQRIGFTAAYVQIEATYLVQPGSSLITTAEVDAPGHTVASFDGSAYDLWLQRNLKHATLVHADSFDASLRRFRDDELTALAGLRSKLLADCKTWPGSRVLDGNFMKVQQAVGTQKEHAASISYLQAFVEHVKSSGMVASWVAKHKADGLVVALGA